MDIFETMLTSNPLRVWRPAGHDRFAVNSCTPFWSPCVIGSRRSGVPRVTIITKSPGHVATSASEREAEGPTSSAWFTLMVLVAVALFSFVDRQIITLAADPLRRSLGLNDIQLGALQGLGLALFAGLASYPVAWLADRFDRRVVLCGCIVVWSLATAGCGLATNFPGLMACATLVAVGEAGLVPIIWSASPTSSPRAIARGPISSFSRPP